MKNYLNKVSDFHKAFGVDSAEHPINVAPELIELRASLLEEENEEYKEAALNNDLVEISDALGDQLYIVLGTILTHGMQDIIGEVFDEIHRSNMSKLGEDGKPIINGVNGHDPNKPKGKILKGANYFEPNLSKILKKVSPEVVGRQLKFDF